MSATAAEAAAHARAAAESSLGLPTRLWRFVRERFPPALHGPAILMFFVTNAAVAQASTGGPVVFDRRAALALVAVVLMFLRLRLFDEVKDYEHDRRHNPGRPLPRGLLTPAQLTAWAAACAALEGAIAALLGFGALTAWLAVLAFTLLMRFEFFARDALRKRLFTYALLHTPSGGLIGLFVYCALAGRPIWEPTLEMAFYALAGWTLLMVFEVARKTYDPKTEPGPDTYSSVFGVRTAALMNALFIFVSTLLVILTILAALRQPTIVFAYLLWGLTGITLSFVMLYAKSPSRTTAGLLRLAVQVYLVLVSVFAVAPILIARGVRFGS